MAHDPHYGNLHPPTLSDILAARLRIRSHLDPSPLRNYPALGRIVGTEVWVKHDNLLPTDAFKMHNKVNLVSQLDTTTQAHKIITTSTKNHNQSITLTTHLFKTNAI